MLNQENEKDFLCCIVLTTQKYKKNFFTFKYKNNIVFKFFKFI